MRTERGQEDEEEENGIAKLLVAAEPTREIIQSLGREAVSRQARRGDEGEMGSPVNSSVLKHAMATTKLRLVRA